MLSPWIITWQGVIGYAYFTNTEYYGHISQLHIPSLQYMCRFGQYQHHSAFSIVGEGYSLKIKISSTLVFTTQQQEAHGL